MSKIRSRDTRPEIRVRSTLHRLGFRFRIHLRTLPGRPDIVLPKHHAVILVHGCFWHRHAGCKYAYTPKSRIDFWSRKFDENVRRDDRVMKELAESGWRALRIWECETKDVDVIRERLVAFL